MPSCLSPARSRPSFVSWLSLSWSSGCRRSKQDLFPLAQIANVLKLLTLARDLRRRKARERQGLFVAEGVRAGRGAAPVPARRARRARRASAARRTRVAPPCVTRFGAAASTVAETSRARVRQRRRDRLAAGRARDRRDPRSHRSSQLDLPDRARGSSSSTPSRIPATSARSCAPRPPWAPPPCCRCPEQLTSGTPRSSVVRWVRAFTCPHFPVPGTSSTVPRGARRWWSGAPTPAAQPVDALAAPRPARARGGERRGGPLRRVARPRRRDRLAAHRQRRRVAQRGRRHGHSSLSAAPVTPFDFAPAYRLPRRRSASARSSTSASRAGRAS